MKLKPSAPAVAASAFMRHKRGSISRAVNVALCTVAAVLSFSVVSAERDNVASYAEWQTWQAPARATGGFRQAARPAFRPRGEMFLDGLQRAWNDVLSPLAARERYGEHLRGSVRDEIVSGGDADWRIPQDFSKIGARLSENSANYVSNYLVAGLTRQAQGLSAVRNIDVSIDTGLGKRKWSAGVAAMGPLRENENDVLAWKLRSYAGKDSAMGVNGGFIYRGSFDKNNKTLIGWNTFWDYERDGEYSESFLRWSIGSEFRSHWLSMNANRYLAITDDQLQEDGSVVYSQNGWDAEARLHAPQLLPDVSLSGGAGYYLWEGKHGQKNDEGVRYFLSINKMINSGLLNNIHFELEHDEDAESGDKWGGKLSFAHRFGAPRGGGAVTAGGGAVTQGGAVAEKTAYNARDYFYAPVRRDYVQRLRQSAPLGGEWNSGGGGGSSDGDNIIGDVNGFHLLLSGSNPVVITIEQQPLMDIAATGGVSPYLISVSNEAGIFLTVDSAVEGILATVKMLDSRQVDSAIMLTMSVFGVDNAAQEVSGTYTVRVEGDERDGDYVSIGNPGIGLALGIVGHSRITLTVNGQPLAELYAFGGEAPYLLSVSASDSIVLDINDANTDVEADVVINAVSDVELNEAPIFALALEEGVDGTRMLVLQDIRQVQGTMTVTMTIIVQDSGTAAITGTYTVELVGDDTSGDYTLIGENGLYIGIVGEPTVQITAQRQPLAQVWAFGDNPPQEISSATGSDNILLALDGPAGGIQTLVVQDSRQIQGTLTLTVTLVFSDSETELTDTYTVVVVGDDSAGDYTLIGADGLYVGIVGAPTVQVTALRQPLAQVWAFGDNPPQEISSVTGSDGILLALDGAAGGMQTLVIVDGNQVSGTLILTATFVFNDTTTELTGTYTVALVGDENDYHLIIGDGMYLGVDGNSTVQITTVQQPLAQVRAFGGVAPYVIGADGGAIDLLLDPADADGIRVLRLQDNTQITGDTMLTISFTASDADDNSLSGSHTVALQISGGEGGIGGGGGFGDYFRLHIEPAGVLTAHLTVANQAIAEVRAPGGSLPISVHFNATTALSLTIDGDAADVLYFRIVDPTQLAGTTTLTVLFNASDGDGQWVTKQMTAVLIGYNMSLSVTPNDTQTTTVTVANQVLAEVRASGGDAPYALTFNSASDVALTLGGNVGDSVRTLRVANASQVVGTMTLTVTLSAADSSVWTADATLTAVLVGNNLSVNIEPNGALTATVSVANQPLAEVRMEGGIAPYALTYSSVPALPLTLEGIAGDAQTLRVLDPSQVVGTMTVTVAFDAADSSVWTAEAALTAVLIGNNLSLVVDPDGAQTITVSVLNQTIAIAEAVRGTAPYSVAFSTASDLSLTLSGGNNAPLTLQLAELTVTVALEGEFSAVDATAGVATETYSVVLQPTDDLLSLIASIPDIIDFDDYPNKEVIGDENGFHLNIGGEHIITVSVFQQPIAIMQALGGEKPYSVTAWTGNDILLEVVGNPITVATLRMENSGQVQDEMTLIITLRAWDSLTSTVQGTYTVVMVEGEHDGEVDYSLDPNASVFIIGGDASAKNSDDVWVGSGAALSWTQLVGTLSGPADRADGGYVNQGIAPRAVAFKNSIYLAGLGNKTVLRSGDGSSWDTLTTDAAFNGLTDAGLAVLNNHLLMVGGVTSIDSTFYHNISDDVWISEDGVTWLPVPQVPGKQLPPTRAIDTAVLNGTLYVIGGFKDNEESLEGVQIWSSTDGSSWSAAGSFYFTEVGVYPQIEVFQNKLYLFPNESFCLCDSSWSGESPFATGLPYLSSTDGGVSWSNVTSALSSNKIGGNSGGGAAFVYNNRLYFSGGTYSHGEEKTSAIFRTSNGSSWSTSVMPGGSARAYHAAVVFKPE